MNIKHLKNEAVELLKELIAIPSFSREEENTAAVLFKWMENHQLEPSRHLNNVYAIAKNGPSDGPVVLLNSHHDTVKPGEGWINDPFMPTIVGEKLLGLGSNDAGASVVSLLATFAYLSNLPSLPFQLIVAITAEEEISGKNGVEALLTQLPKINLGIVGEPTEMKMAVSEKGLLVIDVEIRGKTGHAAREEGENAIYKALEDIEWFKNFNFSNESDFLGPMKMTVTQIEAGLQHNVVPDLCKLVVDIRLNGEYSHQQTLDIINENIKGVAKARSMRLKPSKIDETHPFVQHAISFGIDLFGSVTMSDQALMPFPTVKIGPGVSERSHTPNEFILLSEIEEGIKKYIKLLSRYNNF